MTERKVRSKHKTANTSKQQSTLLCIKCPIRKKDQPTKYNTNISKSYLLKILNKTSHPIAAPAAKKTHHYTAF